MFSSLIFNVFLSHLLVNGVESILNLEYVTYVHAYEHVTKKDSKSWHWSNTNSDLRNAKNSRWSRVNWLFAFEYSSELKFDH